jgi:hypothetical protein
LDEGVTQAEAGRHAGLSRGQLQYWLTKFRQGRLDIFSADLLVETLQPLPVREVEEGPRQEPEEALPAGDVAKAKKAKGRKKKRGKKAKRKPKRAEKKPEPVKRVVKVKSAKKAKKVKVGKTKLGKKAKKQSKKAKGGRG